MITEKQLAALLTKDAFAAWLREQDPGARYVYTDSKGCPIARYLMAKLPDARCGANLQYDPVVIVTRDIAKVFDEDSGEWIEGDLPPHWDDAVYAGDRTYGAALERLERYTANDRV